MAQFAGVRSVPCVPGGSLLIALRECLDALLGMQRAA
jgi:hypothetical protein